MAKKRRIPLAFAAFDSFELEYCNCDVYIYARQYYVANPSIVGPWSEAILVAKPKER
jgi:hypothetical protein